MIIDRIRDIEEFTQFFNERPLGTDMFSFEHIINNPHLFCFYGESDRKLKGYIFITQDAQKRLFLSGAAVKKNLPDNRDAIIKVCEAFKQDIYSDTDFKHAAYMLRLAGFKHLGGTIYIRKFNNGEKE